MTLSIGTINYICFTVLLYKQRTVHIFWGRFNNEAILLLANVEMVEMVATNVCSWIIA